MSVQDATLLAFLASPFVVFAVTLAFASWDETRRTRRIGAALPRVGNATQRQKVDQ